MKTWQVTSDDARSGLAKWADGLHEAFVQLEPFATSQNGFFGQIRQVSTPDLNVSMVTSNGHEVRRLRHHIGRRSADIKFVNILSRGRSLVSQGAEFEAVPMDVSIVDTREPYALRQDLPFQLVSIAVPADWVDTDPGRHYALSRTPAGRELSGIFWGLANLLLQTDTSEHDQRSAVAQQLRHSLGLLRRIDDSDEDRRTSVEMLQGYIQRHYAQPDLRAGRLATHFRMSVRRVHQVFEPTGQTVSEYINEVRLDAALKLLMAAKDGAVSVSDIAWQVGFSDPSYFTRRFTRRFGLSPRAFRQAQGKAPIAHLS
ncbi:helix-turn-helix domain-containing protein [Tateyamaria armeniaca]|uniref:Helix-turn-helix domain-containing protein n=1 Tax=Tateyamaria armeniaca TaxID=2518930 RepID=A0ABW8UP22_9RHOB